MKFSDSVIWRKGSGLPPGNLRRRDVELTCEVVPAILATTGRCNGIGTAFIEQ